MSTRTLNGHTASRSRRSLRLASRFALALFAPSLVLSGCIDALPPGAAADAEVPGTQDASVGPQRDLGPNATDLGQTDGDRPERDRGTPDDGGTPTDLATDGRDAAVIDATLPDIDSDGDGTPDSQDCEPSEDSIHPDALEACNGVDDDCDGTIDEDSVSVGTCSVGLGVCLREGQMVCEGGQPVCDAQPGSPVAGQLGDGNDNNCDGRVDALECPPGTTGDEDGRACMWIGAGGRNWLDGDRSCESVVILGTSGRMATLSNPSQVRLARSLVQGQAPLWVGAARTYYRSPDWAWTDDTRLPVGGPDNLWADREPNNGGLGESCAQILGSGWLNDANCLESFGSLCELELVP